VTERNRRNLLADQRELAPAVTFFDSLKEAPESLTGAQRIAVVVGTIIAAGSRFVARGHSMWDWDEALFCLAVRDYNVVQHHPHPPGYPLFVGAAKLVRLAVQSDLLALQIVVLVAGAALMLLLFFFAREARFPFAAALGGSLIFAFLPNVWIYSGSVMSDVPALALTVLACALLLRGCRSSAAYIAGAVCLGVAAGIRPQVLMVGLVCGGIATVYQFRRSVRTVVAAALLGTAVIAAAYVGAAAASNPPGEFLGTVRLQSRWVRDVDSWHNLGRPPLRKLATLFFYTPVEANAVEIVSVLAVIGLAFGIATRRGPTLLTIATFGPEAIFSWLMLDPAALTRYAISYLPLHTFLAADALVLVSARLPRGRQAVPITASLILAGALAWWTWPATVSIRANDAPPIAAIRWLMHNTYPGAGTLFIHAGFGPYAEYFLGAYETRFFEQMSELPYSGYVEPAYIVLPENSPSTGARVFARQHDRLWRIVRQRNFETSIVRPLDIVRFGRGWHDEESSGGNIFRWMGRSSETILSPCRPRGQLTLRLYVPLDAVPPPTVEVSFNGGLVERFVASTPEVQRSWTLPSRDGAPNELRMSTSNTVTPSSIRPGGDPRELGLKLLAIQWQPSR
jgi:hypothetical protein